MRILLFFLIISLPLTAEPELLWKRAVGGQISAWQAEGPDGTLYLISHDRALHALDSSTGVDRWRFRPGGNLVDFLAVSPDGTIYIQNDRGEIYAVNPEGQARWRCSIGGQSTLLPLVSSEGTLYLLMEKGTLAAISRKGVLLWQTAIPGPSGSPVMDMQGRIAIPLKAGGVALYNQDGTESNRYSSDPLEELLLDKGEGLYGVTPRGKIYYWNAQGELLWNSGTEAGDYSSLVIRKNELYMILEDGLIYRVNQSGSEGFYQGPAPLHPAMVTQSGLILLVDRDLTLWQIDLEKQDQIPMKLSSTPSLPLLTSRGILILGGEDWKLRAYELEPPMEGWAQYRGNASRNGTLYSVVSAETREQYYRSHSAYRYQTYLFETEEMENHQLILDQISRYSSWADLNEELPFWDLMLLKLAGQGINQMIFRDGKLVRTSAIVRAESYRILGQWELFSAREAIISTLKSEDDPLVLAEGYRALGRIGGDWDGQSADFIEHSVASTYQISTRQAVAAAEAYMMLLDWGGEEQSRRLMGGLSRLISKPMSSDAKRQIDAMLDSRLED